MFKKIYIVIILIFLLIGNVNSYGEVINLAWDTSVGATGYKIYSGLESSNYSWVVDVGNVLDYSTLDIITFGYTYYFVATAYDDIEESDYSNEVSYRIMPKPPSLIRLVSY